MSKSHAVLLNRYLQLPEKLEDAIRGLSEADLNLTRGEGWSIRAYVHHAVEGELMWQMFLRAILGTNGIEFPIQWYFAIPQDVWAQNWAYDKRPIEPTLALFHASTRNLVELLQHISADVWKNFGRVTWPGANEETTLTVRDILIMHLRHMDQHVTDIQNIRTLHKC